MPVAASNLNGIGWQDILDLKKHFAGQNNGDDGPSLTIGWWLNQSPI